jgi:hypothetical protein
MCVEQNSQLSTTREMPVALHAMVGGDQLKYRDGTLGKVAVRCLPLREVYFPPESISAVTYCSTNAPLLYFFLDIKSQRPFLAKTATPLISVTLFICQLLSAKCCFCLINVYVIVFRVN